ncbi:MAG: helix-turn-helix domain-containing protein [Pseudomonadota bacterium]
MRTVTLSVRISPCNTSRWFDRCKNDQETAESVLPESDTYRLSSIGEIVRLINSGSDLETILDRVTYGLCRHSNWAMCGIMAIDQNSGYSRLVKRFDPYSGDSNRIPSRWDLKSSPVKQVVRSGKPLIIADAKAQDNFPTFREDAEIRDYRTVVVLPLEARDREGNELLLSVQSRERIEVTESELIFLQTVTRLAAVAVERFLRLEAESRHAERLQKAVDTYSSLMEQVLTESSILGLSDRLAGLLRHPWIVIDLLSDEMVTGACPSPDKMSDSEWSSFIRGEQASTIIEMARSADGSNFRRSHEMNFIVGDDHLDCQVIVEPLTVERETVGALFLFPTEDGFDDLDYLIAQAARTALSAIVMRHFVSFQADSASHAEIMRRLYTGDWHEPREIKARAATLGLDLSAPGRLVVIAQQKSDASSRSDDGDIYQHHSINRMAERLLGAWNTTLEHNEYVIATPADHIDDAKWKALKSRLLEEAQWIVGSVPLVIRSNICHDLNDYVTAREQCARLSRLGQALNRSGFISESDLGSSSLLLSLADRDVAQQFLHSQIAPIAAYDRAHNSNLLSSLKVFLEKEAGYKAAAAELGIHVSTLRYRLERLRDLFGVSATDQTRRFDLQLAIRLYEIVGLSDDGSRP